MATGINVSPGAAVGVVALDANLAEIWGKEDGKKVIMVRPETRPEDPVATRSNNVITHHGVLDKGIVFIQKPFSVNDLLVKIHQTLTGPNS